MTADFNHRNIIFIVDDDAAVRDSMALLLSLQGYATAVFACAEDFLSAFKPHWRGCVVADIRMPGMSGLEMQETLADKHRTLPVIIVTAHGDVAAARRAFKAHAVDFLEKPFDDIVLLQAIDKALASFTPEARGARDASLSSREKQVLSLILDGCDNTAVGERLGISPRTVEVHRHRVMAKLGARNLAELVRIAHASGQMR